MVGRTTCQQPDLRYISRGSSRLPDPNSECTCWSNWSLQNIHCASRRWSAHLDRFHATYRQRRPLFRDLSEPILQSKLGQGLEVGTDCQDWTSPQVSDFPADYPPFTQDHHDRQPDGSPWVPEAILNHGGSCVVGPLGTFLAEPVWDKEDVVYATLNMDDVTESRVSKLL